MCGIAGFVGGKWSGRAQAVSVAARMGRTIVHRGPDHSDVWIDEEARVAFAHDRLAILDLSATGNQPMSSHSGRYVIVYNGEPNRGTPSPRSAQTPASLALFPSVCTMCLPRKGDS